MSEATTKKRRPVKRWIILALILLGAYAAFIGPSILKPISPVVVLPPEPTGLHIGNFQITNTILATLIADVLLVLLAIGALRFNRTGKLIPSGIYNAFETIVEFLYNSVEGAAGKWTRRIFPIVGTIFLLIFVANMIKLFPGFESIGYLKEAHKDPAYAPVLLFKVGSLGVYTIDKGQPVPVKEHVQPENISTAETEVTDEFAAEHKTALCEACEVVPYLRGSATDLNFTFSLAIIAVVMTQVIGVMAVGGGYFSKFFQFRGLITGGPFGAINFGVGLLEIILELAKILSFSFRLFGNIFAGALLLSIIGALIPIIIPPGLYLFEVFFGIIQAYVFFLLATMFMSGATVSHHGGEHAEAH